MILHSLANYKLINQQLINGNKLILIIAYRNKDLEWETSNSFNKFSNHVPSSTPKDPTTITTTITTTIIITIIITIITTKIAITTLT